MHGRLVEMRTAKPDVAILNITHKIRCGEKQRARRVKKEANVKAHRCIDASLLPDIAAYREVSQKVLEAR